MKIKPAQSDNSFKPVEITFVFESQDEMDALAALFNYGPICDALGIVCKNRHIGDIVREGLKSAGASSNLLYESIRDDIKIRIK